MLSPYCDTFRLFCACNAQNFFHYMRIEAFHNKKLEIEGIPRVVCTGKHSFLCCRMRDTARKVEEKYFSNLATHVEFLPVEWRSKLTLDGGTGLSPSAAPAAAEFSSEISSVLSACAFPLVLFAQL